MSNVAELRAAYRRLRKTLEREKAMRLRVFPEGHPKREAKLAELDQALADLAMLGEAIRQVLAEEPPRQAPLITIPARYP